MNPTENKTENATPSPPTKPVQKKLTRQAKWQLGISLLITMSVVAHCAPPGRFGKPGMDITGIVYDQDTKQPLEGAYVMAVYKDTGGSFAGTGIWCVKTKGMYTAKDGAYHFPVEKMDGISPIDIFAIKPDYFSFRKVYPSVTQQRLQTFGTYSNRHVYLKKQDPKEPDFNSGFSDCERPKTMEDVDAQLVFSKIELAELVRFQVPEPWVLHKKHTIESISSQFASKKLSR